MSVWAHTSRTLRYLMRTKWWYRYFWTKTLKEIKNLQKTEIVFSKNREVVQKKCFWRPFEISIAWIDRSRRVDSISDIHFIWIYRETSKIKVKVIKSRKKKIKSRLFVVSYRSTTATNHELEGSVCLFLDLIFFGDFLSLGVDVVCSMLYHSIFDSGPPTAHEFLSACAGGLRDVVGVSRCT